jgi:hypothetical protein
MTTRNGAWRAIQAYVEAILGVDGFATSVSEENIAQRHGLLELVQEYGRACLGPYEGAMRLQGKAIHHIDGNAYNHDPENLALVDLRQPHTP